MAVARMKPDGRQRQPRSQYQATAPVTSTRPRRKRLRAAAIPVDCVGKVSSSVRVSRRHTSRAGSNVPLRAPPKPAKTASARVPPETSSDSISWSM